MPVLPMVLINGADGIGTGWSTSVPNYNPRDVVDNLKRMMEGGEPEPMAPWNSGVTGTIVPADAKNSTFTTFGTVGKLDSTTLHISELPIRKWTQDYKDSVLEPLLSGAEGKASEKGEGNGKATSDPLLTDIREHHTDTTVSFSIKMKDAELLGELETKGLLHKQLKLSSSISTSNMTLFDEHARIVKHETPEDILSSFYTLRLSYYEKRKMKLSESLTEQWSKLDNRMRFVLAVVSGELKISNVKKAVLVETLKKQGYATFEPPSKKKAQNEAADDDEEDDAVDVGAAEAGANTKAAAQAAARGYDYLLGMPLWSLTMEKVEQLRAELAAKEAELQTLLATSTKQLWTKDLDAFLAGYEQWEAELAAAEAGAQAQGGRLGRPGPRHEGVRHEHGGRQLRRGRRRRRLLRGGLGLRLRREEEEEEGARQEGQGGGSDASTVGCGRAGDRCALGAPRRWPQAQGPQQRGLAPRLLACERRVVARRVARRQRAARDARRGERRGRGRHVARAAHARQGQQGRRRGLSQARGQARLRQGVTRRCHWRARGAPGRRRNGRCQEAGDSRRVNG